MSEQDLKEGVIITTNTLKNFDKVRQANNGYPPFWYRAIIMSGLAGKIIDDRIHIVTFGHK